MKNFDIKQVHFTERKINAIFKNKETEEAYPVVGIALLQDDWGHKTIKPLYLDSKGSIEPVDENLENFLCLRPETNGSCQCRGSNI